MSESKNIRIISPDSIVNIASVYTEDIQNYNKQYVISYLLNSHLNTNQPQKRPAPTLISLLTSNY